jgi:hypothetical protein
LGVGHGRGFPRRGTDRDTPGSQRCRPGNEKASRRDGLGRRERDGAGPVGQARESVPIPDGARSSPVSGGRSKPTCPSCLRKCLLGGIHCIECLLTCWRPRTRIGASRCLEVGCGTLAAEVVGVFTRRRG